MLIRLFVCLALVVAMPADAGLSGQYSTWPEGPEGILFTEADKEAWVRLATDAEAEEFIELFWHRRDPDLETRVNEFRTEFEARVELADAEFAEPDLRGAMTDRGKTVILLGVPVEHTPAEIGEYLAGLYRTGRSPQADASDPEAHIQMQGVTFNLNKGRAEIWAYGEYQMPTGIEWPSKDDRVTFAFFDHEGIGHYRMQLGIRKSAQANMVLEAAPGALVRHPDLVEPPVYPLIYGTSAATLEQLIWLDSEEELRGVVANLDIGVAGPGLMVGWLSVWLPPESPQPDTLVGLLTLDGDAVGSVQVAVEAAPVAGGMMIELAVPAPVGSSVFDLALVQGGEVVHSERLDLELEEKASVMLSPVYAGAEVQQMREVTAGHPFVFGGYHLNVRADGVYTAGENLALFCLVTSETEHEGPRDGTVRMRWQVDGQRVPSQAPQPVQFAPAGPGIWVWGTQLPLSNLSADSSYSLKLIVTDSESGVTRETELPINIVAPRAH